MKDKHRKNVEFFARQSSARVLAIASLFALFPILVPGLMYVITGVWKPTEVFPMNYIWIPFVLSVYPTLHSACRYLVDLERRQSIPRDPDGTA